MVYPPVRKIIHSLKLVDYLHVQADKPLYNYYITFVGMNLPLEFQYTISIIFCAIHVKYRTQDLFIYKTCNKNGIADGYFGLVIELFSSTISRTSKVHSIPNRYSELLVLLTSGVPLAYDGVWK